MIKINFFVKTVVHRNLLMTLVFCVLNLLAIAAVSGQGAPDSKGKDFWLAFPQNLSATPELRLFIASETDTNGTVEIPGLGFSTNFTVMANVVTTVNIPVGAQLVDNITTRGIHVTADDEVSVYGLNRVAFTTDAYLGLPTDILGNEYIVLGYEGSSGYQYSLVATQDNTTVNIAPAGSAAFQIMLNRGQTYQRLNNGFSGTIITSDKPVAVFGGNRCANVPPGFAFCDYIVEQIPPTDTWGRNFVTVPLRTRLNGDTFRFLAQTNGTQISVNGIVVATINRGQFHERIINGSAQITSNEPILVAQYSNGTAFDGVIADPFMMMIPPFEQFLADYTVSTPATGFTNYINVVASTSDIGNVTLDGVPIPPASFTPIGMSGFSGAQLAVSPGSHNLTSTLPFGVFVYGFAQDDSYGYPGGLSLAPIARVDSVTLSPLTGSVQIGEQYCVTANVRDQNDNPLEGIRVDFTVSGVNPTGGFAFTNASGDAQFCYTGANMGTDDITAAVGSIISNTVQVEHGSPYDFRFYLDGRLLPPGTPQYFLRATAGSDVQIRFSLNGFQGSNPYSMPPVSQQISCVTKAPIGSPTPIQRYLNDPFYNSFYDYYTTIWRTSPSWAGTCRRITLFLDDGTSHSLEYQFR